MKIFQALATFLILTTSIATIITSPNQCMCNQIQYQQDCLSVYISSPNSSLGTTCRWILNANVSGNQAKGVCLQGIIASTSSTSTGLTVPTSPLCQSITISKCASTLGCALTDGKSCTIFTGCSAYVHTSNEECQAVAIQCTTDGTQCQNKQPCSYYTSQIQNCGLFNSSSGNGKCKISESGGAKICIDQICSDAPNSLTTDLECNSFLRGCISNGAGCATAHVACSNQKGNAKTCPKLIGLIPQEGYCKYSGHGDICAGRTCSDAPRTLKTNSQCIAYLPSCLYTIGQGCTSMSQSCYQLNFALGCSNLVNTSGVACINDTSSNPPTQCREIQCNDNITASTNADCNTKGLTGCVTNGAGCVPSANFFFCTQYTGTNAQCDKFIGANGSCKGSASDAKTSQICIAKTCTDAPSSTKTNKDCAAIQVGCVTTGYGCVEILPNCSSYVPTLNTPCDGFQSIDGPCTYVSGPVCSTRTCAGASFASLTEVITTTNAGCQAWIPYVSDLRPGCVTNGTSCIIGGKCNTLTLKSCQGYNNCSVSRSCVNQTSCSNYQTKSKCISNVGEFGRACIWNGKECVLIPCPFSSTKINTDAICQGFGINPTPGCYFQGDQTTCIDAALPSTTCTSFTGDNSFTLNKGCAVLFNSKCASSDPSFVGPARCVTRTCTNFYQSMVGLTTNAYCNTWLSGCISNGYQGCLSSTAPCPSFFGTQATCNLIIANGNQCYNMASATPQTNCFVKTFDVILQTTPNQIWTDAQCSKELSSAVSSQTAIPTIGHTGVCVPITNPCQSFAASYSQCSKIVNLRDGKCTKTAGFCYPKTLLDCASLHGTSISACKALQYNCTWVSGNTCMNYAACTSYIDSAVNCNALTDALYVKCGSSKKYIAQCIYANFCTDYNTGGLTNAITYCASLQDALANTCTAVTNTDAICSYPSTENKYVIGVGQCSGPSYVFNGNCIAITDSTEFTDLIGPYFMNANNCKAAIQTCTWANGTSCVLATSILSCSGYHLPGSYIPSSAIVGNIYCAQFNGINGTCWYNGTEKGKECSEPTSDCSEYTSESIGQTLSSIVCAQYKHAQLGYCGFDGTNCTNPILTLCIKVDAASITLEFAQLCQAYVEVIGPCSIPTDGKCGPPQATCADYQITGLNIFESVILCQGYFLSTGQKCGYVLGSLSCSNRTCSDDGVTIEMCSTYLEQTCGWNSMTNTCSANRTCSDGGITEDTCSTYHGSNCAWVGDICVDRSIVTTCSMYASSSHAKCRLLYDSQGRQCGWRKGDVNCSDFQCSQIPEFDLEVNIPMVDFGVTHKHCQSLNPACTAAFGVCVNMQPSCYKYKVVIFSGECLTMYDTQGIRCSSVGLDQCTYDHTPSYKLLSQVDCLVNPAYRWDNATNKCSGISNTVDNCSTISAIGSDFAAKLAYCQSFIIGFYQSNCYYSRYLPNGSPPENCVDSVLIPSDQEVSRPNCRVANLLNTMNFGVTSIEIDIDSDCVAFSNGCTSDRSQSSSNYDTSCTLLTCGMASSNVATSSSACQEFQTGCIWNGTTGCIRERESTCQSIIGTVTNCVTFVVNKIPCYQPIMAATTSATAQACASITCANAPSTITNDAGCERWYPSIYSNQYNSITNPGPNLNCVWTGTSGCTVPQSCFAFMGNATTCPTFTAIDGPCKSVTGANCTPLLCVDAPNSYTTDAQCAKFANSTQQCLTTGYGCAPKSMLQCNSIVNQQSCISSSLGGDGTNQCSWLSECVASVTSCTDLLTPTLCITTPIIGTSCIWNPILLACQDLTCEYLPESFTTHAQCSAALSTCTTNGAGCITPRSCTSYTEAGQLTCLSARSQEDVGQPQITKCVWANNSCRIIVCTDNRTATTNTACNVNGLTQCVTTGAGCLQLGNFQCSQLEKSHACLSDGQGNPCIWLNETCQSYTDCTSIAWSTHAQCSQIGCTTNGTNCIALNSCNSYSSAASCIISNRHQICGWLPARSLDNPNAQCEIFRQCSDANGPTNKDCQLYNKSCISNGVSCQTQEPCLTYTQYSCLNSPGTEGQCFWDTTTPTSSCRTQKCTDYIGSTPTDAICASFPAPVINTCTTNGITCVERGICSSYTNKEGCILGTDGTCFWVTTGSGSCRLKMCIDAQFTSNALCANLAIISITSINSKNIIYLQCVSNGTSCIPKSTCSSYNTKIACHGGGVDGSCAFTPKNQTGTCALMVSCSSANSDPYACDRAYDRCIYQNISGKKSCSPLTCAQAANMGTCKPIPTFDYSSYQVCAPVSPTNSTCIASDASQFTAATCFTSTLNSYTWNDTSSSCNFCGFGNTANTQDGSNQISQASLITVFLFYGAYLGIL